jgi:hypothetical protein
MLAVAPVAALPSFDAAVTSVAFAPVSRVWVGAAPGGGGRGGDESVALRALLWLAAGTEAGAVTVWEVHGVARGGGVGDGAAPLTWAWSVRDTPVAAAGASDAHAGAVRKLAWRPPSAAPSQRALLLASAGEDGAVRVFRVAVPGA